MGALMVVTGQLTFGAPPVAADDTPAPLAVFIVGPSAGMTDSNLDDAAAMAREASDAGMRVRKVFHPHATWENVLDAIQGASLVVYMGHGNGYPSPNGPFQEDTKDGFGLDLKAGASKYSTAYYGADKLRKKVQLAKNAVVLLVHLCYASGNGEEYMGPEFDKDIATKRVDNFASGFLDIGARAVFAYGMDQKIDFPRALMRGDRSMDDIFEAPNTNGSYDGFIGTRDYYRDSKRTGWARIHMDPHPREGHYRAVTGDLAMTASEFRAGAGDTSGGGGSSGGPDTKAPVLKVDGSGTGLAASVRTIRFSPNGDHRARQHAGPLDASTSAPPSGSWCATATTMSSGRSPAPVGAVTAPSPGTAGTTPASSSVTGPTGSRSRPATRPATRARAGPSTASC